MPDLVIVSRGPEFLSVRILGEGEDPRPGEDAEGIRTYLVLGAPDDPGILMGEVFRTFGLLAAGPGYRRFTWGWGDFVRRAPEGAVISASEAAASLGITAAHVRRLCLRGAIPCGWLPNQRSVGERCGEHLINTEDLRWWATRKRRPVGGQPGPRRRRRGAREGEGGGD